MTSKIAATTKEKSLLLFLICYKLWVVKESYCTDSSSEICCSTHAQHNNNTLQKFLQSFYSKMLHFSLKCSLKIHWKNLYLLILKMYIFFFVANMSSAVTFIQTKSKEKRWLDYDWEETGRNLISQACERPHSVRSVALFCIRLTKRNQCHIWVFANVL